VRSPQVRNHYAAADHQRHVNRFFLLAAGRTQAIGLNHVIVDAVVATQAGGGDQSHQFLVFCWQSAFQIGVVIQVVKALDEEVVGFVDVVVQTVSAVQKTAG